MKHNPNRTARPSPLWRMLAGAATSLALALTGVASLTAVTALSVGTAHAAAPLADTVIGNQASATYTILGNQGNVTSNTVETKVDKVFGFVLTSNNTKSVPPGGTAYFPHTLTNTANTVDTFNLALTGYAGTAGATGAGGATCTVYADVNGDGQPDNPGNPIGSQVCDSATQTSLIQLGPVAAGQPFNFVVAVQVLTSATDGQTANFKVNAQSQGQADLCTNTGVGFAAACAAATATAENTDTLNVVTGAVFEVIKSVDKTTAKPGDELEYTLTIKNIGNSRGRTTITDIIGSDAAGAHNTSDLEYVVGSAVWSSGGTLTDATGNTDHTDSLGVELRYEAVDASGVRTIKIDVGDPAASDEVAGKGMPQNTTQTVKFKVKVKANAVAGNTRGINSATYNCPRTGYATVETCTTNATNLTVETLRSVTANTSAAFGGTTAVTDGQDASGAVAATGDTQSITGDVSRGSSLTYDIWVWNRGNANDSFVLSEDATAGFPVGTTFAYFQGDGTTPLANNTTQVIPQNFQGPTTNNTACVDPFVANGAACGVKVIVKVTLPVAGTQTGVDANLDIEATSTNDSTVSDKVRVEFNGDIVDPDVTILNSAAGAAWTTGGDAKTTCTVFQRTVTSPLNCEDDAATVENVLQKAYFPIYIQTNLAGNYDLTAVGDAGQQAIVAGDPGAAATGEGTALPPGWNVRFYLPTKVDTPTADDMLCKTRGTSTSTVLVPSTKADLDQHFVACAEVTPPANAAPTTVATNYAFYFSLTNSLTAQSSVKRDDVAIAKELSATLSPNNSNQIAAGSSFDYQHIFTNTGNDNMLCTVPVANPVDSTSGWTSVVYVDANNNGELDNDEVAPITDALSLPVGTKYTDDSVYNPVVGLEKGKAIRYFVKVLAPSGALPGTVNNTTTTFDLSACAASTTSAQVVDTSTVVLGEVRLMKKQFKVAADANGACPTTDLSTATWTVTQQLAKPADCLCYQIVAQNQGASSVDSVTVTDVTPTYTSYTVANGTQLTCSDSGTAGPATGRVEGYTGALTCGFGTMPASASRTMEFCVKIDR